MAATKPASRAAAGRQSGYARVSTDEQVTDLQLDELRAAGCTAILEERASGADRSRPMLAQLLREIQQGETLVVGVSIVLQVLSALAPNSWMFFIGACWITRSEVSANSGEDHSFPVFIAGQFGPVHVSTWPDAANAWITHKASSTVAT
ncbi:MAG: recombinase family protein [Janthinobacterium lividum]